VITYTYVAYDPKTDKKVKAELEAINQTSAAKLLRDHGLSPLEIEVKSSHSIFGRFSHRIPLKKKLIFTRQLATLINAGLPLVQSLKNVKEQTGNATFKTVIDKVIQDVEAGSTFADALSRHPDVFSNVFVSLVAAGETSGTMDAALERLAVQQEKDAEVLSRVRGALTYPAVVLLIMFAVVIFIMTTVLPQVESLYKSLPNVELPFFTKLLLGVSHLILHFWWLFIIIVFASAFLLYRWSHTEGGKSFFDSMKLNMPLINELYKKVYMARFARTGSTLIASGIPLLKMLEVTAEAVDNVHIAKSISKAAEQVKGGKNLSASLKGDPYFLDLVPNMIGTGEQSGSLAAIFDRMADYYEKEVDSEIKTISTIIEPTLMVFIGILALFIVAAILLPIYSLAGKNLTGR